MNVYAQQFQNAAAYAPADARAAFIRRTYMHLAIAILAFVAVEYVLLTKTALPGLMLGLMAGSRFGWLMILGGFVLVGWLARGLAASSASSGVQYAGLFLFVLAQAVIFIPILTIAMIYSAPSVIPNAAILTGLLFLALTTIVFTTRKDFSFLRGILAIGGFLALGAIVIFAFFPANANVGLVFALVMVVFAGGAILYDTSKILHHYSTDRHVAASLELFASVALMFYYILMLLMRLQRR